MQKKSTIDRVVGWGVDRYSNALQLWNKANIPGDARSLIGSILTGRSSTDSERWNEDEKRRIAASTSWIYSDIRLLGQEFSGADMKIIQVVDNQEVEIKNHDAEQLFKHPNDVADMIFIWQYTMWWLNLRGNGYWFLAPEAGDPNKIVEIWPVPADRITPLVDKTKLIGGYAYKLADGSYKRIDPRYIVHFMFPNPFSLIDGMPPLSAAHIALETEIGISTYQRDMYVTGRGVPHTVLALPQDTGERDFISISSQIREEFEQERKIIVTRSGDINVAKVGLTNREMDLVAQRNFTRDELDTIFLGFSIHSATLKRELDTIDKMIKEKTVYPLHRLLAGQLTLQFINPYYGKQYRAEFEDIRAQDRALLVQERNVYWRAYSFDGARKDLNLLPYDNPKLPGLGDLPLNLATDPQFVMGFFGLGVAGLRPDPAGIVDPTRKKPTPTAAMPGSDAPKNTVDDIAAGKSAAELAGIDTELTKYKKVVSKAIKSGKRAGLVKFESEIIPKLSALKGFLLESDNTAEGVSKVFETFKADLRGGGRGRRNKQTTAVNAYQDELGSEFKDWCDETASELAKSNPEDRNKVIDDRLAILLLLLIGLGRKSIPDALDLAVGDNGKSPAMVDKLSALLKENEVYLTDSLIPAIKAKLLKAFDDQDIQIAIQAGDGAEVLGAVLSTVGARVESYAGTWWQMHQWGTGLLADELGQPIKANLDPLAEHCADCPQFHDEGGREYASFQDYLNATSGRVPGDFACHGNDRCWLSMDSSGPKKNLAVLPKPKLPSEAEIVLREATKAMVASNSRDQTIIVNVPESKITVNVPEQHYPDVIVNVPQTILPDTIVNVSAPNVTVESPEINIPETVVNFAPPAVIIPNQAAPIVNVSPAQVTVNVPKQDAPVVNVEAPQVNVSPVVRVSPSVEETKVERDRNGLIVSTTTYTRSNE
jgi:hypothetical protein